jgi:hypothetical protein
LQQPLEALLIMSEKPHGAYHDEKSGLRPNRDVIEQENERRRRFRDLPHALQHIF